jgi:hypothetical protein
MRLDICVKCGWKSPAKTGPKMLLHLKTNCEYTGAYCMTPYTRVLKRLDNSTKPRKKMPKLT